MGTLHPIDIAASHRTHIGCSKIAQALGISRWGTPYDLWANYTGRQPLPDISNDLRVALGEPMEAVLKPFVEQRLGGDLRRDRKEYIHPTLPLIAHVDFRLAGNAKGVMDMLGAPAKVRPVVDIKTSLGHGAKHRFGADGTDELDADVLLQMHGYLLMTGASLAYVAALVPGPEIKMFTLQADPEMKTLIEDGLADFWRCVTSDTPPEARSEADARRLWTQHLPGKTLDDDGAVMTLLQDLAAVKASARTLEVEEQAIKNRLMPLLADYEAVTWLGKAVATYRANKASERVAWQEVAQEYAMYLDAPDAERIRRDHTVVTPGARVLRLTKALEAA